VFSRPVSAGTFKTITYVAIAGVTFQILHFSEHIAQLGYWFLNPLDKPWLTPWAAVGRDALAAGGDAVLGTEFLHLIGNGVFFGGVVVMCLLLMCKAMPYNEYPSLNKAVNWQGFHLVEHISLTLTWMVFGNAIGVSTLFGFAGGAFGSSYRVWWHFAINLIATIYAVKALKEFSEQQVFHQDLEAISS